MENKEILVAETVNKKFGGVQAIFDLNIKLRARQITGLIGTNGAGKTTFFNLISGIFPVDSGEIRFLGEPINEYKPFQIAQLGISRTFQTLNVFPRLSVFENVRAGIESKPFDDDIKENRVREMLSLLNLSQLSKNDISQITPVARRLVEVGRTLISDPKLVLFDEIMAGFNEQEVLHLIAVIREFNRRGVTFCIIGHTMRAIMDVSDLVIVMHAGRNFAEGTPDEIQNNLDVQKIYMGTNEI